MTEIPEHLLARARERRAGISTHGNIDVMVDRDSSLNRGNRVRILVELDAADLMEDPTIVSKAVLPGNVSYDKVIRETRADSVLQQMTNDDWMVSVGGQPLVVLESDKRRIVQRILEVIG